MNNKLYRSNHLGVTEILALRQELGPNVYSPYL